MSFGDSHQYRCIVTGKNGASHGLTLSTDRALSASDVLETVMSTCKKGAFASLEIMEALLQPSESAMAADAISFHEFIAGFEVTVFNKKSA